MIAPRLSYCSRWPASCRTGRPRRHSEPRHAGRTREAADGTAGLSARVAPPSNTPTVKLNGDALTRTARHQRAHAPLPCRCRRRPRQWWPLDARDGDRPAVLSRDDARSAVDSVKRRRTQHRTIRPGNPRRSIRAAVSDAAGRRFARSERLARIRGTERTPARRRAPVRARSADAGGSLRRESRARTDRAVFPPQPHIRFRHRVADAHHARTNRAANRQHPLCGSVSVRRIAADGRVRVENGRDHRRAAAGEQQVEWDSALANDGHAANHSSAAAAMDRTMDAGAVELLARRLRTASRR